MLHSEIPSPTDRRFRPLRPLVFIGRQNCTGRFSAERVFGVTLTNSDGKAVPVRFVGEQHVKEDLGFIPTVADWLKCVRPEAWMMRRGQIGIDQLPLSGRSAETPAKGATRGKKALSRRSDQDVAPNSRGRHHRATNQAAAKDRALTMAFEGDIPDDAFGVNGP